MSPIDWTFEPVSVSLAQHSNTVVKVGIVRFADAAIMTVADKRTGRIKSQITLPLEALDQIAALR